MFANANGWHGPPIKADDEAKTGRLREDDNAECPPTAPVPFGLPPKTTIAALQSLAGFTTRLRLRVLRWAFSAVQRVRKHSLNRPFPSSADDGDPLLQVFHAEGQRVADHEIDDRDEQVHLDQAAVALRDLRRRAGEIGR